MNNISPITQTELVNQLHYDSETGVFTWKTKHKKTIAGRKHRTGYIYICINKKHYRAHRLAWLYVYGEYLPSNIDIDHIDGVRDNNRISNLRKATRSQNCSNSKCRKNGLKWAYFHKPSGKWLSIIRINKRRINVGIFDTEIDAHNAAFFESLKFNFDFTRKK